MGGLSLGSIGAIAGIGSNLIDAFTGEDDADQTAKSLREQSEREKERTKLEIERHRRQIKRLRGDTEHFFLSRGVAGGSSLDIIANSMAEAELDERIIASGGEARASNLESRADSVERRGRAVFQGGMLSAGARLIRDFDNLEEDFGSFFD